VFESDVDHSEYGDRVRWPIFPAVRLHLESMSDAVGVWQHARGTQPDRAFGYCTDDVARALVVDALHSRQLGLPAVDWSIGRSLRFIDSAYDHASGRFLNFRAADGRWLDLPASEDCHARAMVGLAAVMEELPLTDRAEEAGRLFQIALPASLELSAPRAVSAALLACDSAIKTDYCAEAEPAFRVLAKRLVGLFGEPPADWPWFEQQLTYENAIVPRALIVAGSRQGQVAVVERGCAVLDWLIRVQVDESGSFSPIGNSAWWSRTEERSRFDQQPIEAAAMVSATADAFRATGRRHYLRAAESAYGWFLGSNDLGVPLALPASGGCQDGLTPDGPNTNQGAESTLMWLTALEQTRDLRRTAAAGGAPEVLPAPSADGPRRGE